MYAVMFYVRGAASDYDDWAALGNDGWSFNELLPFVKKVSMPRSSNAKQFRNNRTV